MMYVDLLIDGVPRMRERSIADLIDGLKQLGADVSCVEETGCPPATIHANNINGGSASISGKMAAPLATDDITIIIKDELISSPYVGTIIGLMKKFGVKIQITSGDMKDSAVKPPTFYISKTELYISPDYILVGGDARSSSYLIAGAATTGLLQYE